MKTKKMKINIIMITTIILIIMILLTVFSIVFFNRISNKLNDNTVNEFNNFDRHYAFITQDYEEVLNNEIFNYAKEKGYQNNVLVEWFGKNVPTNYSKKDILKIAIDSNVDGIILEGDIDQEFIEIMEIADQKNIPIVNFLTDTFNSTRKSFIGVGSYALGQEYAREIIRIATKNTKNALILINLYTEDTGQNIVYKSIQETLFNEGNHLNIQLKILSVDDTNMFSAEEMIRSVLSKKELPEIIICLNEENTNSVYRSIVDFNRVGETNIIGYSTSTNILQAIERNVITSTIAVDSKAIGTSCVDALNEFIETGFVSDFITINVKTVTLKNVGDYLKNETNN